MENYVVVLLHASRQQNLKPHLKRKEGALEFLVRPSAPDRHCVLFAILNNTFFA